MAKQVIHKEAWYRAGSLELLEARIARGDLTALPEWILLSIRADSDPHIFGLWDRTHPEMTKEKYHRLAFSRSFLRSYLGGYDPRYTDPQGLAVVRDIRDLLEDLEKHVVGSLFIRLNAYYKILKGSDLPDYFSIFSDEEDRTKRLIDVPEQLIIRKMVRLWEDLETRKEKLLEVYRALVQKVQHQYHRDRDYYLRRFLDSAERVLQ